MIKEIEIDKKREAETVLNLQIPAYKVEADIIGSDEIPPLKDTVETIQSCEETFYGYYLHEELCGAISVKVTDEEVDIHRLIVHPDHFRKGIAQKLLDFVENQFQNRVLKVATGAKNTPAVQFYEKNGFEKRKEVTVSKEITLTFFERRNE